MRSRSPALAALLAACALVLVAGCGQPDPEAPLEVGTGDDGFEYLDGDTDIAVISGDQGGYHIWMSIRCTDCSDRGVVAYGVVDADSGQPVTQDNLQQGVRLDDEGDWRETSGLTAFLEAAPSTVLNRRVKLWAELTDDAGGTWEASVEATVTDVD